MAFRALAPLSAVICALAITLPVAALPSDVDRDRDGLPDALEDVTERVVLVGLYPEADPWVVQIKSSSRGASPDDILGLEYGVGRITAKYYANASSENATVAYRLRFRELVEVRGPVGNEIRGGDIVRSVALEDLLKLGPIVLSTRTTQDHERETAIDIGSAAGTFSLTLHVITRFSKIDGRLITPMEVGADVRVRDFTVAPGNEIAVRVSLESQSSIRLEESSYDKGLGYADDERAMNVSAAAGAMFLAWSSNATVNGQPRAVRTTTPVTGSGYYEMYFVYGYGSTVDQAAKVGAVSQAFAAIAHDFWTRTPPPIPQGDTVVFVLSAAALSSIVAVTALWRRRRRLGR